MDIAPGPGFVEGGGREGDATLDDAWDFAEDGGESDTDPLAPLRGTALAAAWHGSGGGGGGGGGDGSGGAVAAAAAARGAAAYGAPWTDAETSLLERLVSLLGLTLTSHLSP